MPKPAGGEHPDNGALAIHVEDNDLVLLVSPSDIAVLPLLLVLVEALDRHANCKASSCMLGAVRGRFSGLVFPAHLPGLNLGLAV
eukprot:CAMPEP_0181400746 /NCGR_PEP_ID=MMETSP1110-20121109/2271_1 /TAXON_ID=174948 /ORGANISM="Symbiodinium sp., Strain CCMP421" /LENGTH=84 /DNA_ID=CAMNT_0023522849 /DNA_START=399 /DNA_END=653 /DNA_ORIENTATION=+